eukprot:GSMAST32.ASY1.ANO1.1505.1 assembled CDS
MDILLATLQHGIAPDDPQASYIAQTCCRIGKTMGSQFVPYLPLVLPSLLNAAANADKDVLVHQDSTEELDKELFEGREIMEVIVRGAGKQRIGINTAAIQEKSLACNMLYEYAMAMGGLYAPWVEKTVGVLLPLVSFQFSGHVRVAAAMSLPKLLLSLLENPSTKTSNGPQQLFIVAVNAIVNQLKVEQEVELIVCLHESLDEMLQHAANENGVQLFLTDAVILMIFEVISTNCIASIKRRINACRALRMGDAEADDVAFIQLEEEEELEGDLLNTTIDVIGALAKLMKGKIFNAFNHNSTDTFFATDASTVASDSIRSGLATAALCIADDIIEYCMPGAAVLVPSVVPYMLNGANSPDPELRQSAVYGLGVCAERGGSAFTPAQATEASSRLVAVVTAPNAREGDNACASDNAITAVAKLFLHRGTTVRFHHQSQIIFFYNKVLT